MNYYYARKLEGSFDGFIEKIKEGLKEEGFGVLSDVNVKELFKSKLDIDFRQYRILGACNPVFSHKALLSEARVGTMLPCNIIVQETSDGKIEVSAVDPVASMLAIDNDPLKEIAAQIGEKLVKVVDKL